MYFTLDTTMSNSTFFATDCTQADVAGLTSGLGCDVEPVSIMKAIDLSD
jgi:hypothetical protein